MLGNEFRIQINQCDHLQQYTLVMTVRQEGRGYEVHAELVGQSTGEGGIYLYIVLRAAPCMFLMFLWVVRSSTGTRGKSFHR